MRLGSGGQRNSCSQNKLAPVIGANSREGDWPVLGRIAVVDGINVAHEERSEKGRPKVGNIVAVNRTLKLKGYEPIIIVDARLKQTVDNPEELEFLIRNGTIRQAPAGTDINSFLIRTAEKHRAVIVTNDRYGDYEEKYPWVKERRVPLMITDGEVELYEVR